jgi:hypothetical protein
VSAVDPDAGNEPAQPNSMHNPITRPPSGWQFVRGRVHVGGGFDQSDVPELKALPRGLAPEWSGLENTVMVGEFVALSSSRRLLLVIEIDHQKHGLYAAFASNSHKGRWKKSEAPASFSDLIARSGDMKWL